MRRHKKGRQFSIDAGDNGFFDRRVDISWQDHPGFAKSYLQYM